MGGDYISYARYVSFKVLTLNCNVRHLYGRHEVVPVGPVDSKMGYRKTKTQPPGEREEHAGVLYKGNLLFITSLNVAYYIV